MKQWDIFTWEFPFGKHPVVIVSHPARVVNKPDVNVLKCSSTVNQRRRTPNGPGFSRNSCAPEAFARASRNTTARSRRASSIRNFSPMSRPASVRRKARLLARIW